MTPVLHRLVVLLPGLVCRNRRRFFVALWLQLLLALTLPGEAKTATTGSTVTTLATGWEHYRGSLGSAWEVWRGDKATDNVEWSPVTLPHCFNERDAVEPDARYYQGPGWYRTRLNVANPFPNGRTLLHFNGAGQRSEVYVGLEKVGEHLGGYDEWEVDITEAAQRVRAKDFSKGAVPIAVMCDNSRDAESIPSDLSDFVRYAGLYRHVYLKYVPAISLQRVHIEPSLAAGNKGTVKVRARFYNPSQNADKVELIVTLRDSAGKIIGSVTRTNLSALGTVEAAVFEVSTPQRWSPKSPQLYSCTVQLKSPQGEQGIGERFGFRSFEWVEHGPFKLNGERLLLRGTHYHEDHAGVGAAVPDEVVRQTFRQIKAMGANFVRLGHYQQAPLVLELCDELGLLVWEEIPWCRGGLGGERYQQQARDMLCGMIDQHYNHPSVILWGLGNENAWPGDFERFETNAIRSFMAELNTLSHQLDPARKTTIRHGDFCKDLVDVYSPSIWAGWYSGRYPEYRNSLERTIKSVPHFFHAEYGGDSHAGRYAEDPELFIKEVPTGRGTAEVGNAYKQTGGRARASKDGDWSESYIANLFDWHLLVQEQMTNLTGAAQWIFKDFATPLRPENPVPRVNQKGVVERDGTPKDSYYIFQSYWAEAPMIHIFGHKWETRWGKPDELKEVKVFSNCREVELFVNGVSAGVRQRNQTNFPAAGLHWQVRLNEGRNSLRAIGKHGNGTVTDELSWGYQTAPWESPAHLTFKQTAFSNSTATIEVRAFDRSGVACLDAANLVRFGLTGDGRLVDNLGTATGSRVVQLANGHARIDVQLTGGRAVTSVSSEGLPTEFLELNSAKAVSSKTALNLPAIERERVVRLADAALQLDPPCITSHHAKFTAGGPNDFYSNADYFWPDPAKPDSLPYINRDGESNPGNFNEHRMAMREMRDAVAALAAAYKITSDERYVAKAVTLLRVFFLDPATRMNPHLKYAQAVPGRSTGRSWGIIDGLHLVEVPPAITALQASPAFPPEVSVGLKRWFQDLTDWMMTSEPGRTEAAAKNNHSVAFFVQIAAFAKFTGDEVRLAECRRQYKEVFLPNQMAVDGSFPLELKRTKPYAYSIFQLDNMAILCQVLSTPQDDLWHFELPDQRGIRRAMAYLYPFLADKSKWPLPPDVQAWEGWPTRQPGLLFAGLALGESQYLDLWRRLPADPADAEVRRNIAITQPILWLAPLNL